MTLRKFNFRSLKAENVTAGSNVVFGTANVDSSVSNTAIGFVLGWPSDYVYVPPPPPLAGSTAGYVAGGAPTSLGRNIQNFSFSSDASAVDTGADLFFPAIKNTYRTTTASHVGVNGYTLGGYPSPYADPSPGFTDIHKFSFTSATNSSFVGTITSGFLSVGAAGTMSLTDGYKFAGQKVPTSTDNVDRVPFSSDTDSVDVGELSSTLYDHLAATNGTYAWLVGGVENYGVPPATQNADHGIKKVSFASAASDSDVGNLTYRMLRGGVAFDTDNGYVFGGRSPNSPAPFSFAALPILKWPFASNTPSTEIAPLALPDEIYDGGGHSSQTHGYYSGGGGRPTSPEPGGSTRIHKFPFSSNSPGVDVGELASAVSQHYGLHT